MNEKLTHITTHLIAGPLGAGKTSLVRHLLGQRPAGERWAVLVNEFGQVGLDAALMATADDGIAIGEVAGGCVCCVNGAPFQVGLARLLRKARPQRLFIEASGLGHPLPLLKQLRSPPWEGVLQVQPLLMVAEATAPVGLHPALEEAYAAAGLIVINKAGSAHPAQLQALLEHWQGRAVRAVDFGQLPLAAVPVAMAPLVDKTSALPPTLEWPAAVPQAASVVAGEQGEHWSIGWRWPAATRFDLQALAAELARWPWLRAKAVIHTSAGFMALNAKLPTEVIWNPSQWSRDSRLELIFATAQPREALEAAVAAARV
ncbi:GTP-binding protein [Pseudomonas sp. NPDC007930]|uniref:CobW family GTP-binding protein n=1 Tax=Pseudomonas sp. NPDC007930 TaxID=3364417 RepID=UPI0036EFDE12